MTDSTQSQAARELGIAGTGRIAKAVGALLVRRGFRITAIAARSLESAREAARFVGSGEAITIQDLPSHANRILIAVSDDAIGSTARTLADAGLASGIVLHTAAAAGPEALACLRTGRNSTGVLHPLQTVPTAESGIQTLPGAAFACAGDESALSWARSLIDAIGGKALAISAAQWPLYHAAAVFASNYQVTMIDAALELMQGAGLDRRESLEALSPLVRATTENVLSTGPEHALTGPIRRGDCGTVRKHLMALDRCLQGTKDLYVAAGLRTVTLAERSGLRPESARAITKLLEETRK